jgi:hypothetical protein
MRLRVRMPAALYEGFEETKEEENLPTIMGSLNDQYKTLKMRKENKDKELASGGAVHRLLNQVQGEFKQYVESSGREVGFAGTQKRLDDELKNYDDNILFPLINLRKEIINSSDMNLKISKLNTLENKLADKRQELEATKDNYSTAQVRDKALNTRNEAVSYQQTWGLMKRPIKKQTIPVLIVFTLLFIFLGIIGIYYISPVPALATTAIQSSGSSGIGFFTQNPLLLVLLQTGVVIGIILIIFKILGLI